MIRRVGLRTIDVDADHVVKVEMCRAAERQLCTGDERADTQPTETLTETHAALDDGTPGVHDRGHRAFCLVKRGGCGI